MKQNDIIKYKGYYTHINCDIESGVLWGKIEGISDLVTFEGDTVQEAKKAFIDSVDDYLDFCLEEGKKPEKPYSGTFNIRINPETHKRLTEEAYRQGKTLNALISDILDRSFDAATNNETTWEPEIQWSATATSKIDDKQNVVYLNKHLKEEWFA